MTINLRVAYAAVLITIVLSVFTYRQANSAPAEPPYSNQDIQSSHLVIDDGLSNSRVFSVMAGFTNNDGIWTAGGDVNREVTVRSHVSRILDKLHVANRVQATLYALREGLASLNDPP